MSDARARFSRVLIPLDPSPEATAALEAAAALAARLHRPLEAVFIEDADLLAFAALPFTREVTLSGRPAPDFDSARVERELRLRARVLKGRVERLAVSYSLTCSFRVVRGRREEELSRLHRAGDLLALSVEEAVRPGGNVLMLGPHCRPQSGPVMLLVGQSPDPEDLSLGEALARDSGQELLLLTSAQTTDLATTRSHRLQRVAASQLAAVLQAQQGGLIVARKALLPEPPQRLTRRLRVPLLLLD
ncbi:MAG: hypothetical protein ACTS10_00545 [Kiloniellales bacterium]